MEQYSELSTSTTAILQDNSIHFVKYAERFSRKDRNMLLGLLTGQSTSDFAEEKENPVWPVCGEEYDTSLYTF